MPANADARPERMLAMTGFAESERPTRLEREENPRTLPPTGVEAERASVCSDLRNEYSKIVRARRGRAAVGAARARTLAAGAVGPLAPPAGWEAVE